MHSIQIIRFVSYLKFILIPVVEGRITTDNMREEH